MVKCTLVIIEFVLENKQETDINEMYLGLQKKKKNERKINYVSTFFFVYFYINLISLFFFFVEKNSIEK